MLWTRLLMSCRSVKLWNKYRALPELNIFMLKIKDYYTHTHLERVMALTHEFLKTRGWCLFEGKPWSHAHICSQSSLLLEEFYRLNMKNALLITHPNGCTYRHQKSWRLKWMVQYKKCSWRSIWYYNWQYGSYFYSLNNWTLCNVTWFTF